MKKVIKISLILLIAICISGNVYATLKCNINMKTEKLEYNKGDTFTVDVNISNIESDRGVISFGGTLEYDKDSLKLEKIQGVNGWETPTTGLSYNESNGKFVITKSEFGKNDETIFKLTFTVKNESKQSYTITLKDMSLADGITLAKVDDKSIIIKEGNQIPNPQPGDDSNTGNDSKPGDDSNIGNDSKPGDNSNTSNNSRPGDDSNTSNNISDVDNTVANNRIPKAGKRKLINPISIGIIIISAGIIFFIKIKKD